MAIVVNRPTTLTEALKIAAQRGILPSALSSREQREALEAAIRKRAVFSARVTNAEFLSELKRLIQRLVTGGYNSDRGQLRVELRGLLQRLGYTPDLGFPGDEALGVPPAEPGSLQDLSSDARLNLILETQERLMRGASQKAKGQERMAKFQYPAWELLRLFPREVPRGSPVSGSTGWKARWVQLGGPQWQGAAATKMIAHKDDPIWAALGDSNEFSDALDVDHPPFAFNSGFGWRAVPREEWEALVPKEGTSPMRQSEATPAAEVPVVLPPPVASTRNMDADIKAALLKRMASMESFTAEDLRRMAREERIRLSGNALLGLGHRLLDLLTNVGSSEGARKGWETRRRNGWQPSKKQGPLGRKKVGLEGTADSLQLPALHELSASQRPSRISAASAMEEIRKGLATADPLERAVTFGRIVEQHMEAKQGIEDFRVTYLPHAKAAVSDPLEVWEHGHRHYYIGLFEGNEGKKGFIVVAARMAEGQNEVITYHPNDLRDLRKSRKGKLLFTRY